MSGISISDRNKVEEFANLLLKAVGKQKRRWKEDIAEYIGGDPKSVSQIVSPIESIEIAMAMKTLNEDKRLKIEESVEYDGGMKTEPWPERIEVDIDKYEILEITGYKFCVFGEEKVVIHSFYDFMVFVIEVYAKTEETAKQVLDQIFEEAEKNSLYKGKKLEMLKKNRIAFLKLEEVPPLTQLILPEGVQQALKLNLLLPLREKEKLEKSGIPFRRGIIMYGPPGTGKTLVCKSLTQELETTVMFFSAKAADDPAAFKALFSAARKYKPTAIFLEDLDLFGKDREGTEFPGLIGELLNQLDGAESNDGVFVIATTNRREVLDKALADRPSRFDISIDMGDYDELAIRQLFTMFLEGKDCYIQDIHKVVELAKGLTPAHIKEAITSAFLTGLNRDGIFTQADLEDAIKRLKGGEKNDS